MELPQRLELETKFGNRMYRLHARHRDELRTLLDGDPNAPIPYTFWDRVRRENETELVAILLLLFGISANYHVTAGGYRYAPLKDVIELRGRFWAASRGQLVGNAMANTAQKRLTNVVQKLQAARPQPELITQVRQAVLVPAEVPTIAPPEPETFPELDFDEELDKAIDDIFSRAHADFVAMSETTAAQSAGGEEGVRLTVGTSILDRWRTNPGRLPGALKLSKTGPCPICKPMDSVRRLGWIDPRGPGPWIHPGCVCDILYHNIEAQRRVA
jgi:hypothetical protein